MLGHGERPTQAPREALGPLSLLAERDLGGQLKGASGRLAGALLYTPSAIPWRAGAWAVPEVDHVHRGGVQLCGRIASALEREPIAAARRAGVALGVGRGVIVGSRRGLGRLRRLRVDTARLSGATAERGREPQHAKEGDEAKEQGGGLGHVRSTQRSSGSLAWASWRAHVGVGRRPHAPTRCADPMHRPPPRG